MKIKKLHLTLLLVFCIGLFSACHKDRCPAHLNGAIDRSGSPKSGGHHKELWPKNMRQN